MNAQIFPANVTEHYGPISPSVLNHNLTLSDISVLIVLSAYGWRDGFAFPSLQTIMQEAHVSRRALFRSLALLAEKGLVTKSGKGWKIRPVGQCEEGHNVAEIVPIAVPKSVEIVPIMALKSATVGTVLTNKKRNKIYMPTTNVRRVSDDDDDRPQKKPAARSKSQAVNQVVEYYAVVTKKRATSFDRKKLGELYADFGEELGPIIKVAWSKRDELVNERFPVFTAQTVWLYANFKHVPKPVQSNTNIVAQIVKDATENGILNESALARSIAMHGLQERDLLGHLASDATRQSVWNQAEAILVLARR